MDARLLFLGIAALLSSRALAQDFDPASLDLPKLIACEAEPADYNDFAFWLSGDPDAIGTLGWAEVATENLFLREFRLPRPIEVLGRTTDTIVFTSSGPMAVFAGIEPQVLAASLGVPTFHSSGAKYLGEKVVVEREEKDGETTILTRVALNVSTVETHPGKVLAGCSYSIEVR